MEKLADKRVSKIRSPRQPARILRVDDTKAFNPIEAGRLIHRGRLKAQPRWSHLARSTTSALSGYVELGKLCRAHQGSGFSGGESVSVRVGPGGKQHLENAVACYAFRSAEGCVGVRTLFQQELHQAPVAVENGARKFRIGECHALRQEKVYCRDIALIQAVFQGGIRRIVRGEVFENPVYTAVRDTPQHGGYFDG